MKTLTQNEFLRLVDYVKSRYGVNLIQKKALIIGRLQNYLVQNNFNSFSDYFDYVISDKTGVAATELINKLTTNHTYFMREPEHYELFKNKILPELVVIENKTKDFRIWSAGCSSGEEPYTLAMIMMDYFGGQKNLWDTKILATDISSKVLETAIDGIYSGEDVERLPKKWKLEYMSKIDSENYKINDEVKREVIFRKFNLMEKAFPFRKRFHVIFCRNVMIYFDAKTKKELIDRFYEFLEPGGYLLIGHSESISREESKFVYELPAVYRKK